MGAQESGLEPLISPNCWPGSDSIVGARHEVHGRLWIEDWGARELNASQVAFSDAICKSTS